MSVPRPDHRRRHPPSGLPRQLGGAALGLLGVLCLLCPAHDGRTDAASDAPREVPLVTAIPAVRESALIGFTRPVAELPLVAESEGRVKALPLEIGDPVETAGWFARLDTTFLELEREEIAIQQARLGSRIAFAEREVTRYRALASQQSTSLSELEALEQDLTDSRLRLQSLLVTQRTLDERIARATIVAPVGWLVTARQVELGQWVRSGEILGSVADFSTLLVPFALTPEQFSALTTRQEGLALELLDQAAGTKAAIPARIHRVNPGFDATTRKIAVDLALAELIEPARGGLRVRLRLPQPEATGALSVPASAVGWSYEESWVSRPDGTRLPVVRLGPDPRDPGRVRVTSPLLAPGDSIRVLAEP